MGNEEAIKRNREGAMMGKRSGNEGNEGDMKGN